MLTIQHLEAHSPVDVTIRAWCGDGSGCVALACAEAWRQSEAQQQDGHQKTRLAPPVSSYPKRQEWCVPGVGGPVPVDRLTRSPRR